MADFIKSPLTERQELQLPGVNEDIIFYTVLDQSESDGLPGRDRKLSLKNIERYLFGYTTDRTVEEIKYTDEMYIIGDDSPNKTRTKITIDTAVRFIVGENNNNYVFDNDDTIMISKKPVQVGGVGERVLTSINSLKEEIRETIRHWKTITVGYDALLPGLKNNFHVNENGELTIIGSDSGNISMSFSKTDGLKSNKIQAGWDGTNLANYFSVDLDGNIIGKSLTSLNPTRFSISDAGLAKFRTLEVGHDGTNFQPYFNVANTGDAVMKSITSTTTQMFSFDNNGKGTLRTLQVGANTGFYNGFNVDVNGSIVSIGAASGNASFTHSFADGGKFNKFQVGWDGTNLINRFVVFENGSFQSIGATSGNNSFTHSFAFGTIVNKFQVGWSTSALANRFIIDENGSITAIGAASGNASFTTSFTNGIRANKLQIGWDSTNLANRFAVDENGSITCIGAASGNASFTHSFVNGGRFNKLQTGWISNALIYRCSIDEYGRITSIGAASGNASFSFNYVDGLKANKLQIGWDGTNLANKFSVDIDGNITGLSLTSFNSTRFSIADSGLARFRTLQVGHDGTNFQSLFSVTNTGVCTAVQFIGPLTGNATSADKVNQALSLGTYLSYNSGTTFDGSAARTINTNATSANTANTLVARDASGNFSAGTITATLTGNASSATKLATARTINGVSFDGTANITIAGTTDYSLTAGTYLTGGSFNGSAARTFAVDATSANTASKVVARDANGNFSAGTITATLSGNATTATRLQTARTINGVAFDGSANITVTSPSSSDNIANYLVLRDGSGNFSAGTITAALSGNATTATRLQTARTINGVSFDGTANITVTLPADSNNTANTLVQRDASGNFSAGTITANLSGNATTATRLQTARTINGVSFDGTQNIVVSSGGDSNNTPNTLVQRDVNGSFYSNNITINSIRNTFSGNIFSVDNTGLFRSRSLQIGTSLSEYDFTVNFSVNIDGDIIAKSLKSLNTNAFDITNDGIIKSRSLEIGATVKSITDGWTSRTAFIGNWRSVTYGNGMFVAVGTDNIVMTSPDGITWTTRAAISGAWSSVTYGNGMFVAVSYGTNIVMTSPDGITWTSRTAFIGNWYSVTYGNGLFVAVGYNNIVMTSPDGITWTSRTAFIGNWYSVTYGNGLFVAVSYGTNIVMTSPDGITWTSRTAISGDWYSVTYGNGMFVAVGSSTVMTSPDGITWTTRAAIIGDWRSVTYGNGMFVAVGYNTNIVMTSPDGITWTSRTAFIGNWRSVTYGNGMFVAVGTDNIVMTAYHSTILTNKFNVDENGVAKNKVLEAGWDNSSNTFANYFTVDLNGVTKVKNFQAGWDNNSNTFANYFTVDENGNVITNGSILSNNGSESQPNFSLNSSGDIFGKSINSSAPNKFELNSEGLGKLISLNVGSIIKNALNSDSYSLVSGTGIYNCCYGNGVYVGTKNTLVYYSINSTTWVAATTSDTGAMAFGKNMFITSRDGKVIKSLDGASWTEHAQLNIISIAYGIGIFVAVVSDGIYTSTDGITWILKYSYSFNTGSYVAFGNNKFVVIKNSSNSSIILLSTNGLDWTPAAGIANYGYSRITFCNGYFFAHSGSSLYGYIQRSIDGVSWSSVSIPSDGVNYISCSDDGLYIISSWDYQGINYAHSVYYSTNNCATWNTHPFIPSISNSMISSAFINGRFFVTRGSDMYVLYHSNVLTNKFTVDENGSITAVGATSGNTAFSFDYAAGLKANKLQIGWSASALANKFSVDEGGNIITSGNVYDIGLGWKSISVTSNTWKTICYGNGIFVVVNCNAALKIIISTDGITWTEKASFPGLNPYNTSIAYGNGLFVILFGGNGGPNGIFLTSPDGINWTQRYYGFTGTIYSVYYNSGIFVAVGNAGSGGNFIYTSPDGINWTPRYNTSGGSGFSVSYGNGVFVIAGGTNNSRVITSLDNGITWIEQNIFNSSVYSKNVCYGNGLFVAICDDYDIVTSPDGINWTLRNPGINGSWSFITYVNGLFIAIQSGSGTIITSPDGINWTQRTIDVVGNWTDLCHSNGVFVVISSGTVFAVSGKRINNDVKYDNIYQGERSFYGPVNIKDLLSVGAATGNASFTFDHTNGAKINKLQVGWTSNALANNFSVSDTGDVVAQSLVIGSPTGGNKGAGTINAIAVYDDNILLTKYVLDYFINKDFIVDNYLIEKKAVGRFLQYKDIYKNLDTYNEYIMNNKILPSFADIENSKEIPSVGTLAQRCWEELEIKTIHIMEIHNREKELELQVKQLENRVRELENAQIN